MAAMAATGTTKAEADNKEMQAQYSKQIAEQKAADEDGKEEAKAHVDETAAGIKANNDTCLVRKLPYTANVGFIDLSKVYFARLSV